MYFFTGRSLDVICDQAGLQVDETVDDEGADFLCKIFSMREAAIDYLPSVCLNEQAAAERKFAYCPAGLSMDRISQCLPGITACRLQSRKGYKR